jgi:hypothetical protein
MSNTGWSSSYYELPPGATELQDLIEHREMNFAVGNIFKACYRLGMKPGADAVYDLEKVIWFAQRELARHKAALTKYPFACAGPLLNARGEVSVFDGLIKRTEGWPSPRCSKCQKQICTCQLTPAGG